MIEIYIIKLNEFPINKLSLTADDKSYLSSIKSKKRKLEWAVSQWARRTILSKKLNCPINTLIFKTTKNGRPYLNNYPNIDFNISHSGEWLGFAFTKNQLLGIDIERTKSMRDMLEIAKQFFSKIEHQVLSALEPKKIDQLFYQLWTLKEAHLKISGKGIVAGLDKYPFQINDKNITPMFHNVNPHHYISYQLANDYVFSLAIESMNPSKQVQKNVKIFKVSPEGEHSPFDLKMIATSKSISPIN